MEETENENRRNAACFPTTLWTVVMRSAGEGEAARAALEDLCVRYWRPVYFFFLRGGNSSEDAKDLTQGFFADFLRQSSLTTADSEKGKFRNFLLTAAKRYQAKDYRRRTAAKRGGGEIPFAMDIEAFARLPAADNSLGGDPERDFDRQWAVDLVGRACSRLREVFENSGRGELFEAIRGQLVVSGGEILSHEETARRLGMSESAVKTAVFRLRKRFADLVREEVAETLAEGDDLNEELKYLLEVLRSSPGG